MPQSKFLEAEKYSMIAQLKKKPVNLNVPSWRRWDHILIAEREQVKIMSEGFSTFLLFNAPPSVRQTLGDIPMEIVSKQPRTAQVYQLLRSAPEVHLAKFSDEIASEMRGVARVTAHPIEFVIMFNLMYELTAADTSVGINSHASANAVACAGLILEDDKKKSILHGRILDWAWPHARNATIFVDVIKDDEGLGLPPGRCSLASPLDKDTVVVILKHSDNEFAMNVMSYFHENHLSDEAVSSFLIRRTLEDQHNFNGAITALSIKQLHSNCYLVVTGSAREEGAVITRGRHAPLDTRFLNIQQRFYPHSLSWYLLQTNDDWWGASSDNRRQTTDTVLEMLGKNHMNTTTLLKMLQRPPLYRTISTFVTVMDPRLFDGDQFYENTFIVNPESFAQFKDIL